MANFEKQYSLRKVKQPTDEYIEDVKQALIDKGIVNEKTPYSELDDAINDIELPQTWGTVSNNLYSYNTSFHKNYLTSNRKYMYCSTSDNGLYVINCETKETKQIISSGNWTNFVELSDGCVLVYYLYSGSKGIYKLVGDTAVKLSFGSISETYGYKGFYEANDGTVYFYNANNIFKLKDDVISLVTDKGGYSSNIWEYDGLIYFRSGSASGNTKGLYCYDGENVTLVLSTSGLLYTSPMTHFLVTKNGTVYGYNTTNGGILKVDGVNSIEIKSNFITKDLFEDKKGNVYQYINEQENLYILKDDTLTVIPDTKYCVGNYIYDNDTLYMASSSNFSDSYLMKVDGENITKLNAGGYIFVKSNGIIYGYGAKGLITIQNGNITVLNSYTFAPGDMGKNLVKEDGTIYIYPYLSNKSSVYYSAIIKDNKLLTNEVCSGQYKFINKGEYVFADTEVPVTGSYVLKETENGLVTEIYIGE